MIEASSRANAELKTTYRIDWHPRRLPDGARCLPIPLRTDDGAATTGFLYSTATTDRVVAIMHPRESMASHYLVPDLLAAGFAVWTQQSRTVGNDLTLEHETILLDVAAGLNHLHAAGFKKIVLLGNSGGASLFTLYVQQSSLARERRLDRTPGGRPVRLGATTMPAVDAVIYLAPHPGQGLVLLNCIDPSVTDESDPLSVDPALDPFSSSNGFADPPQAARYAETFVHRYRAAQRARVGRLDARARELIAARAEGRRRAKESGAAARVPFSVMTVWRTDADLRCFDLGLDPSDRDFGSVWGQQPLVSNYAPVGFGRLCTPEAWLSTWSGLSSNAAIPKTASAVTQPVLLIEYSGDSTVFPADVREIFATLGTSDKRHEVVRGDHYGRPLAPGEPPGRDVAGRMIQDWLRARFG